VFGFFKKKAAFVGSLGCVQALVNRRAFVKAEDIDGNTPLLLAMKEVWICLFF
jgi:hypothetical protein